MDVNNDNDLSKEDDVRLTKTRNSAFVAMLFAAVVAFSANAHVKAGRAPDGPHFTCPWDGFVYQCEQDGGDAALCPTTLAGVDAMCTAACSDMDLATPGIEPGGVESCKDGPPMKFPSRALAG